MHWHCLADSIVQLFSLDFRAMTIIFNMMSTTQNRMCLHLEFLVSIPQGKNIRANATESSS